MGFVVMYCNREALDSDKKSMLTGRVKILLKNKHLRLLKRSEVIAVYLFGSRALGLEHPWSDYDYAILTKKNNHTKGDALYRKLYHVLSDISPRSEKNDLIDIVYLRSVNLELAFHIIRYGQLILDRDPIARLECEVMIQRKYCDFKPILDAFDHRILESL